MGPGAATAQIIGHRHRCDEQADQFERRHEGEHVRWMSRQGHIPDTPTSLICRLISACRNRNRASSSFLRRIQLVTSVLHLLVLHERQHGTTLASSYRPPRDIASTQSLCRGVSIAPQYAQPPQANFSASHCKSVRSCTFAAIRRLRRRAYLVARVGLRVATGRGYRGSASRDDRRPACLPGCPDPAGRAQASVRRSRRGKPDNREVSSSMRQNRADDHAAAATPGAARSAGKG